MRIFRKLFKFIIVSLISVIAITLAIIGLYYLFNGGIQYFEEGIKNEGLVNTVFNFCKQFWKGLKTTLGF